MATVTVSSLNETFQKTRKDLFMLPSVFMGDEMSRAGIAMIPGIQDELKTYSYLRHSINMMPYKANRSYDNAPVGEIKKNILKVYLSNTTAQDNIQDYVHTDAAGFTLLGTNKTYKNPAERLISYSIFEGVSEAILNRMWFMIRNEDGTTTSELADGFLELIRKARESGEISAENRNLIDVGPITAPIDETDTTAYQQAKEFLKRLNPALLRGRPVVNLTVETGIAIQDAMRNSSRYYKDPERFGTFTIPEFPNVIWNPNLSMGYGDFMQISQVGNMMYGFDSISDDEYLLARQIDKDPNVIDYWLQMRLGFQYETFHQKGFACTTGTLNPEPYEGDIKPSEVYTLTVNAGANGTVTKSPEKAKYAYGDKVKLTATPTSDSTHEFEKWSDGSLDATRNFSVSGNLELTATFKAK